MVKTMTPKELARKTIQDIINRRLKGEKEFNAYQKERSVKKMRNWSVRVGGCRW